MKKKRKKKTPQQKKSNQDLSELTKLIRIIAAPVAIDQIEKLASSDERKAIWVLCSGKLTREQVASKSGMNVETVKRFVSLAMTYGLLEEEKGKGGHPKRTIDYVPSDWKKLVKKKKKTSEEQKPELSTKKT